ncbi:unnamed protein product [Danaus chrysippus]|uniref:(African queen) hypothetical protein n=1 Tax=Danaus chrysippus TaxID=151541 RepID=A0A8J2W3B1_9NEOP|nr:unnamed protein product [Danaus chrysippus]
MKELTQDEVKQIQNKNIKDIQKYLNYSIQKRKSNLQNAIDFYATYFQSNSWNPVLIAENYSNKMNLYFNKTFHKDDAINDIDKHFVILDIVETSNNLLYKVQLNILHNETNRHNYSASAMKKFYKLLDDLNKDIRTDKEEEMKYICAKFEICRAFPGFSDHISDFLGDILNYSDGNITDIYILAKILIKEKINYFRNFLDDDLIESIGDSLSYMFGGDESELIEVFSLFRKMLSGRHKFSVRKNIDKSVRAKVIRLLIDIVDKTFVKDDDEVYLMYIDMTRKSLRKLTSMTEHQMGKMFSDFIRYIINTIKYNWTPDCKREVRTLLEVLMKNSVTDRDVYEYLIKKGSQYVNTKPLSDIDLV